MIRVSRTLTSLLMDYYGRDHQMLKVAEELAELMTVIIQGYTKRGASARLTEELYSEVADVYIMLDQMVYALLDDDAVNMEINRKLNRQFERLKNEQREKEAQEENVYGRRGQESHQGCCGRCRDEDHASVYCGSER